MKAKHFLVLLCVLPFHSKAEPKQITAIKANSNPNINCVIKALRIGDHVPNIEFKLFNSKIKTTRLSDYKEELIILDFWGTYCGSCLDEFPKLNELQKEFQGKIKILLVNSISTDDFNKIDRVIKRMKNKIPDFQLSVTLNDTSANSLFPHQTIPHCVWITSDGKVKWITEGEEVTQENVRRTLKNENFEIKEKKDFFSDKLLQLAEEESIVNDDLSNYLLFKRGKIKSIGYINQPRLLLVPRTEQYNVRGITMANMPILEMYQNALFKFYNINWTKQVIIEAKDSSELVFNEKSEKKESWEEKNLYTYDMVMAVIDLDSIGRYVLNDLNKYSNYYGRIEKRKVKCLALVRTSILDKLNARSNTLIDKFLDDQPNKILKGSSIDVLVDRFNSTSKIKEIVINETDYKGRIDIELCADFANLSMLRSELSKYDLDLKIVERELDCFVINRK